MIQFSDRFGHFSTPSKASIPREWFICLIVLITVRIRFERPSVGNGSLLWSFRSIIEAILSAHPLGMIHLRDRCGNFSKPVSAPIPREWFIFGYHASPTKGHWPQIPALSCARRFAITLIQTWSVIELALYVKKRQAFFKFSISLFPLFLSFTEQTCGGYRSKCALNTL